LQSPQITAGPSTTRVWTAVLVSSKPLKALETILELINEDNVPEEFNEMCEFLKKQMSFI